MRDVVVFFLVSWQRWPPGFPARVPLDAWGHYVLYGRGAVYLRCRGDLESEEDMVGFASTDSVWQRTSCL